MTDPNRHSYYANPREWHVHLWCADQQNGGRHYQVVVQDMIDRYGDMDVSEFRRRLKCRCGQGVDWRASARPWREQGGLTCPDQHRGALSLVTGG